MPQDLLANFVYATAQVLEGLLWFYTWLVIGAVVVSWVNADPRNPIVRFLYATTEPVLYQLRRRLPFVVAGGIDFSPLVLILAIQFVRAFVVRSLFDVYARMHGS
ncbi:MAG TPA: YggT family protein [Candidatus Binatia bacterium]|jgi:YggT family protein|nr:YggT family protein [Candidatus Binatia bacterium]